MLLVVVSAFASAVQAQHKPQDLRLFPEDFGKTFHITTGTLIEVNLFFSDLHVSYDPTKLQFLDYTLPAGVAGTVESGVIVPEGGSVPETQPSDVEQGSIEPGTPPTEITPETQVGQGGVASGAVVVVPAVGGDGTNIEASYTTYRFLAIGSGQTSLELLTFRPPCQKDQPCIMMPDFLVNFELVIEGDAIGFESENPDAEVIIVKLQPTEPTIQVKSGQVVMLDVSNLKHPLHVIYHPGALRLLAGEDIRFWVNPWGMTTRVGVQTSNGELFSATLVIEPECDSCGVRSMPPASQ